MRKWVGEGTFAEVYLGYDPHLDREVALKVARPGTLGTPKRVRRFLREARAAGNLRHPNIVPLFETGEDAGRPFLVSAFVHGQTLGAVSDVAREAGGLPLREAAGIARRLAEALGYAHGEGVIHRDVKPENVMIDGKGEPLLMDFGLASRADPEDGEERLTQHGVAVGTPAYMAPEQARADLTTLGPAADQYALGCTLFELLTGRTPFSGPPEVQILLHQTQPPPSPRKLRGDVSRDLETICLKCLEKDPQKRYVDCRALADDLRSFLEGRPITARPVGLLERVVKRVKRNPVVTAMATAVVLALTVGTTVSYLKYRDAEEQRKDAETQKGIAEARRIDAEKEAEKAKKAREFLVSIFQRAETDVKGGNLTVRQLLAEADIEIPVVFADQPELRGELVAALGKVKHGIARRTPQAMILEVRGGVQLQSATGKPKAAVPQSLVNLDDRLSLSADAQVQLVFLSDLHKERLRPGREVTVSTSGCEPADAVRERDNSILMTFAHLPKGTFYMGWDGTKKGVKTEIKKDFEIAVHDVTQGQWEAVMGKNPSWFSRTGNGRAPVVNISDEELKLFPVEMVSWDDCQEFLKKLNEKEKGGGWLYRLPTEAEWEYSRRGGATSEVDCSYHFYFDKPTNDLSSHQANFEGNFPFGKGEKGPFLNRPTRVGAYPANTLGLCDMHGNVWQWCADLYDPKASGLGASLRVHRGGSWYDGGTVCRAAGRYPDSLSLRSPSLGLRLARVPSAPAGK